MGDVKCGQFRVRRGKRTDLDQAQKLGLYLVDNGEPLNVISLARSSSPLGELKKQPHR